TATGRRLHGAPGPLPRLRGRDGVGATSQRCDLGVAPLPASPRRRGEGPNAAQEPCEPFHATHHSLPRVHVPPFHASLPPPRAGEDCCQRRSCRAPGPPSPACGGGLGGGSRSAMRSGRCPPSRPSPAGGGGQRVGRGPCTLPRAFAFRPEPDTPRI